VDVLWQGQVFEVVVEVDVGSASSWGRRPERWWLVRLRRGDARVVVAVGLSRAAAEGLAGRLSDLLCLAADVADRARSPGTVT
jgi:hypothetical protein